MSSVCSECMGLYLPLPEKTVAELWIICGSGSGLWPACRSSKFCQKYNFLKRTISQLATSDLAQVSAKYDTGLRAKFCRRASCRFAVIGARKYCRLSLSEFCHWGVRYLYACGKKIKSGFSLYSVAFCGGKRKRCELRQDLGSDVKGPASQPPGTEVSVEVFVWNDARRSWLAVWCGVCNRCWPYIVFARALAAPYIQPGGPHSVRVIDSMNSAASTRRLTVGLGLHTFIVTNSRVTCYNGPHQLYHGIPHLRDPANVEQLARVFWIHLLEVCWTFAGSCNHPISNHRRLEVDRISRLGSSTCFQLCYTTASSIKK